MAAYPRVGDVFAGHRIEALIGHGGMGVVYLAEHLRLGRKVAIKVLSSDLAQDGQFRDRFLRETRAAATLSHPNIVPVYDAGEVGGLAYFTMQYVEGADLAAILRRQGTLDPGDAVSIMWQVASALDAAHAEGFVHRDVKPANILLERERQSRPRRAYLSDFGITKRLDAEGGTTGQFLGTIDYMAPEQITGGAIDGRTDQYSLACVLFRSLTGSVPFARDEQVGVMYAHLQETPPTVARLRPDVTLAIDEVLRRAMAKPKEGRYPTCAEFSAAAAGALGVPLPAGTTPASDGARSMADARTATRKHPGYRALVIGGAALAVVAVLIGAFLRDWSPATGPARRTGSPSPTGAASPTVATPTPNGSPHALPTPFPAAYRWVRVADPGRVLGGPEDQSINRAIAASSRVVAVGFEGTAETDAAVWVSSDGAAWDRAIIDAGGGPGNQNMAAVVYDGHRFVAVGTVTEPAGDEDGAVWTSTNGQSWERVSSRGALGGVGDQEIRRIIQVGGDLFAIGWDSSRQRGRDAAVWRYGGTTWSRVLSNSFAGPGDQEMWNIVRFGGALVAVGTGRRHGDSDAAVWRYDGATWSRVGERGLRAPGDQVMKAVVMAGPGLVAVGSEVGDLDSDAAVWTSPDGLTWTRRRAPGFRGPGLQEMNGAIAIGRGVVAVGAARHGTGVDAGVWTSPDGIHWTLSRDPGLHSPGSERLKGIVVLDGILIAVGHATTGGDGNAGVWLGTPIPASPTPSPTR